MKLLNLTLWNPLPAAFCSFDAWSKSTVNIMCYHCWTSLLYKGIVQLRTKVEHILTLNICNFDSVWNLFIQTLESYYYEKMNCSKYTKCKPNPIMWRYFPIFFNTLKKLCTTGKYNKWISGCRIHYNTIVTRIRLLQEKRNALKFRHLWDNKAECDVHYTSPLRNKL